MDLDFLESLNAWPIVVIGHLSLSSFLQTHHEYTSESSMSSTENIDVQLMSIFNLFIWKYKQQTIVFRFWHHFERNWSLKWAMCFCFVKELNCFTNHYFSLPFSSEVFTESKVEVKMRFFHLLLCCWVSASMAAVPVILDTDMDFDVDDVGALCVLHALQVRLLSESPQRLTRIFMRQSWLVSDWFLFKDLGEAELIGVVHNAGYPKVYNINISISTIMDQHLRI